MSSQVKFVWAGISYYIPEDTTFSKILLPTGVVLEFNGFLETHPPQLAELKAAGYTILVHSLTDLAKIAEKLNAVPAIGLSFCPDHPYEHGNFCSVCGKPIHLPSPLAPKTPFPSQGTSTPMDVQGSGPCPNCGTSLNHDTHAVSCPNCGQALHWTCRSRDSKQPKNWDKQNPI